MSDSFPYPSLLITFYWWCLIFPIINDFILFKKAQEMNLFSYKLLRRLTAMCAIFLKKMSTTNFQEYDSEGWGK